MDIKHLRIALFGAALVLLTGLLPAYAIDYKEYQGASELTVLFELTFDNTQFVLTAEENDLEYVTIVDFSAVEIGDKQVTADGTILFDRDGAHVDRLLIPYEAITDIRVIERGEETVLRFFTRPADDRKTGRIRRGNRMSPFDPIVVEDDEFVRGMVFTVTGGIDVYGEVNKDVVSLFGDVFISPDAVARGDIVSVRGHVDADSDASVYGGVYTKGSGARGRRHRFYRREMEFNLTFSASYNRVDGFAPALEARYDDRDSVLPSAWAQAAYAFESKRWRYNVGAEQTLLRRLPVSLGGALYRELKSEDTWLLKPSENTAFSFFAGEDFRDYYEAEGGTAYIKVKPWSTLTIEGRFTYEETKWLDAERDLYHVFGGDKKFKSNFWTVEPTFREIGKAEIDTGTNGYVSARVHYDTRDEENPLQYSSWAVTGDLELAHQDLESDYDYRSYKLNVRRYQRLHRRALLMLRGIYAGSDGYLPMYKRHYLGGLGTLHGYKHKEYLGTRYWLANAEYRIDFPRSDIAASLIYDVGRISNQTKFSEADEIKHGLGVALYVGEDFKVSLSKRLDGSTDESPVFYVRLTHIL
ncbi:MAG: BamA/TamA family outer membrane protein [candidate division Zixibacteria bacterium]|nr:BamA/TamA family outer membrane protein [candidate division Zixibacteria bacterium]